MKTYRTWMTQQKRRRQMEERWILIGLVVFTILLFLR